MMNTEKEKREGEMLSAEDERLRALCGSLKRAEAPKDFDFKFKARLAEHKTRAAAPRFGYAFRYALPALALILMLGLFAYTSGIFSSAEVGPVIATGGVPPTIPSTVQAAPASNFTSAENSPAANANVAPIVSEKPPAPEYTAARQVDGNTRTSRKNEVPARKKDIGGGSKDIALTYGQTLQPNSNGALILPQNNADQQKPKTFLVKDLISSSGIDAELENGRWKVKSVAAESAAEASGVKANDVIEAVDDEPISGSATLNKSTGGKTLTVLRDGKKIVVKLPNK